MAKFVADRPEYVGTQRMCGARQEEDHKPQCGYKGFFLSLELSKTEIRKYTERRLSTTLGLAISGVLFERAEDVPLQFLPEDIMLLRRRGGFLTLFYPFRTSRLVTAAGF